MSSIMSNLSSVEISILLFRGFSFLLYGRNCILLMPSRLLKCGPLQRGQTEGNLKCDIVRTSLGLQINKRRSYFLKAFDFGGEIVNHIQLEPFKRFFPTVLKLSTCFKLQVKTKNANESLNNF